jgi:hypothetical protein
MEVWSAGLVSRCFGYAGFVLELLVDSLGQVYVLVLGQSWLGFFSCV